MKMHTVKGLGCLLLALMGRAHAQDVEGMMGMLNIRGAMHEMPCGLEMTSAHQTIDLGAISAGQLQRQVIRPPPGPFNCAFRIASAPPARSPVSVPGT